MKHYSLKKGVFALLSMVTLLLLSSVAEGAGSTTGTATATVVSITGVGEGNSLDFGDIVAGASAGTVTINAGTGARTGTGGIVLVGSAFRAATFNVYGFGNKTAYNVNLSNNNTVTISNGSQTMHVINFTSSGSNILDGNQQASFKVGATLEIAANQATGHYTGTYHVVVTFN